MDTKKQKKIILMSMFVTAFILSTALFIVETTASGKYADIGLGPDLFGAVYKHILFDYVKETNTVDIAKDAVNGMLEALDPYSQFIGVDEFGQFMDNTKGEFGGLGIEISTPGDYPQIMSYPIEGTPAEKALLRAGDLIVEINGESTFKMPLNEVVNRLRGVIGSSVDIKIKRGGTADLIKHTIIRDRILLHNVTYAGEIEPGIGYIKLRSFNQTASPEMDEALKKLEDLNVESLILDLRGNPGGLLLAAQEVANKFLGKETLIVFTKDRSNNRLDFKATEGAKLPSKPLVILIDRASASASEIVAGAIQDQDRGILIGETSFGKGSVQTIFQDLPGGNGLKLTTSLYYTPSGRCINKERTLDELMRSEDELDSGVPEEAPQDTLDKRDKYYTLKNNRIVYGEGGITPDIIIKYKKLGNIVTQLIYQNVFFNFAVEYSKSHEFGPDFTVTDDILNEFKRYIADKNVFEYTIPGKSYFDGFRKQVSEEGYNGDIILKIDALEKELLGKQNDEFEVNREAIKRFLKRDIASAKFGSPERTIASKDWDIQLKKSIEILRDREAYDALLAYKAETGVEHK